MTCDARHRRALLGVAFGMLLRAGDARGNPAAEGVHPSRAWYLEARRMRELAESWGDQAYGAVVVAGGRVVGEGPSRVVKDGDPEAHAERVAIRAAQRAQGHSGLAGAVLYSTSRPCPACERAAAAAGILRMYHGESLADAGVPQPR